MDTEPTICESEIRKLLNIRDDVEMAWTEHGWAVRQAPEPGMVPITIAYIHPPDCPSDAQ